MKIIKEQGKKFQILKTKEIRLEEVTNLSNPTIMKILYILKQGSFYPKQIAEKLKIHEQNIYYYIRKLEKTGIINVEREEIMQGTKAKFYTLSSESYFFTVKDFYLSSKIQERESKFLKPFMMNGELDALIIVGSPEPHGPLNARSRDGYFGMDLALFLGTFLNTLRESKVKLDTETNQKDIENNSLILIGGPIVNKVTEVFNKNFPIYYEENKKGFYSLKSKKSYIDESLGIISKCTNPYNKEKYLLLVAGVRNWGTKAAIIAFLKHFEEFEKNNMDNFGMIVRGLDLDSDGLVDDVEILEQ
ncbi:helix-turn-helix domain-containing protein [Candidatus Pacearchaeota archaeon]|nr:helix-turn-helix domain-containing protein [Candidatus Pacearchaeota archaeon]